MKNHGILLGVLVLWLTAHTPLAHAGEQTKEDDAYDFSWLDPDKKIYVLQNRKYTKATHPIVSLLGGFGLSGPYVNAYILNPRVSYFFSEDWGFDVFYTAHFNRRSATYDALVQSSSTAIPRIREIGSEMGAMVHWSPWYAKINVFNNILYFDWYFNLGAGTIGSKLDINEVKNAASNYVDQSFFAIFWGTGHQYHLSPTWIVQLDLTGAFYQAPLLGTTGDNTWFSNYNFTFGVGMRL